MAWTLEDAASQAGKTFLITGANSGLGLETARMLAELGARVICSCRSQAKVDATHESIRSHTDRGELDGVVLDLARLDSVRSVTERLSGGISIDALINNAGIMAIPRTVTADGFEMQFATNHLGHFALTAVLFSTLRPDGRVVNVSSFAHRLGRMNFDDLMGERAYQKWRAYGQSKLANILFTLELQRKLDQAGSARKSVACHPGYAGTNLQYVGPQMEGKAFAERVMRFANRRIAQSARQGAWPTVRAAVDPTARGGDYFGPNGFMEARGDVDHAVIAKQGQDRAAARQLWEISEELSGVPFQFDLAD